MQAQIETDTPPDTSDFERYQVYSRFEIVTLLREVADAHALVTIYFNRGTEFIVTSLLDVNPEFEELIYDLGADSGANQRLLKSSRMTVVTFVDSIKLQFAAQRAEQTTYEGLPALRIRMPDSMLRLQRRNTYRIRMPLGHPVMASVPDPANPARRTEFRILDISCGGNALVAGEKEFLLEPGTLLQDCRIELPGIGVVTTTLEVRSAAKYEDGARRKLVRYGCQFAGMPTAMVNAVQRYITKVERERAQRR